MSSVLIIRLWKSFDILFSSKETLFPRYTSLSPSASMVKKISEYLETLSALFPYSSKREKRYPRHMNGFPRSETFISSFRRHRLQENREKKCAVKGKKVGTCRDLSLSMAIPLQANSETFLHAKMHKFQVIFFMIYNWVLHTYKLFIYFSLFLSKKEQYYFQLSSLFISNAFMEI